MSANYTPVSPGVSTLDFQTYIDDAAPGNCFYADDAVLVWST